MKVLKFAFLPLFTADERAVTILLARLLVILSIWTVAALMLVVLWAVQHI